jgi:hypothetical protein
MTRRLFLLTAAPPGDHLRIVGTLGAQFSSHVCRSVSFGEAFVLTGGREGPQKGEGNTLPVGEVVRVYPRNCVTHVCILTNRGQSGWGDSIICLSSKATYSLDLKLQASFACGLPDYAVLTLKYEESHDGFFIARLLRWDVHEHYPTVELIHALYRLPLHRQMFICLAVLHCLHLPLPFENPRDMFPFEPCQLQDSAAAAQAAAVFDNSSRVDMRHAAVFFHRRRRHGGLGRRHALLQAQRWML